MQVLAVQAYKVIGCEGAARVDFRLSRQGRPVILEVNTIPGMTERSLLPMAATQVGLTYDLLVEGILKGAMKKQGKRTSQRVHKPSI